MRLRDRDDPERIHGAGDGGPAAGDAAAARDEGEAFLAAADEAIERALSRDSRQFLAENRQQSGQ